VFYEYPYLEIDQNVSSYRWQEFIKIATIISLKNMLTTWLVKHGKSTLVIFSNLVVTFTRSIRQLLTYTLQAFG